MTNVVMMIFSLFTPINVAVSGSWATARMPRPVRDLLMKRSVTTIMMTAAVTINI